jgi:D-lactate dehydrogenase
LARDSDIVVFNVPLTKETQHMVNTETIPRMKRGAALDVYQDEAPIFYSDRSADVLQDDAFCRLMTFPNLIVTSHMVYLTDHALSDIAQTALQAFSDFEKGRPLATRVVASGPT